MQKKRSVQALLAVVALVVTGLIMTTVGLAQTADNHAKKNVMQRHPTATGVVAGVATRAALKASAKKKKAQGKKLNWAERHPTLTGIGAGVAARHYAKKSGQNKH